MLFFAYLQTFIRLTRDITLEDLEEEDMIMLESGAMTISSIKDQAGRAIMTGLPHRKPEQCDVESIVRFCPKKKF